MNSVVKAAVLLGLLTTAVHAQDLEKGRFEIWASRGINYDEFKTRTVWSLSNAFTSAFKDLEPIPQFRATAKLGGFLEARFRQSF
jgi:hypothetical protein